MIKINTYFKIACSALAIFLLTSCGDDDDSTSPAPITANFSSTDAGINDTEPLEVKIIFSRAVNFDGSIELSLSDTDLIYGEDNDFYTDPATVDNTLTLPFVSGDQEVSYLVYASSNLQIEESHKLTYEILSTNDNFSIGNNSSISIEFSENYTSQEGVLLLNAGSDFSNQVFADFSKNTTSTVSVESWDLGFYSGESNNVLLNGAGYVMARPIDKTDLTAVTSDDTVGFATQMVVPNYMSTDASQWIDDQSADLSKTAFGTISSSEENATVFIVKRDGNSRNWKKVKIFSNANTYTIQHADIDATTFTTTEIAKSSTHDIIPFDLDKGVNTEVPQSDSWDIMYSKYSLRYPYQGGEIVYGFLDYIVINTGNVQVASVEVTEQVTYDSFSKADAASLQFNYAASSIGSSWRETRPSAQVLKNIFYVLQDSKGNFYKISFESMTNNENERGHTSLKYKLLQ